VPFLRVIRDKRGYETTYLMHLYREGHRQRSRILYVFRSPGSVRVGREALDPEVLREIEAHYPDIAFDWKDVRDHQQHIEISGEPRRRKPPKRDDVVATTPEEPPPITVPALPAPAAAPNVVPPVVEGATPDDQIAFLGRWYGIIRERIPRRTSDPLRQEALFALAERLNPAAWTDADQIAAGLQQASEALERLSRVFSRRRRRPRRRSDGGGTQSSGVPPSES
jgi:hypothetical protein